MSAARAAVPIFIICRDRLTPLLALLDWLERAGERRIVLIDNDSTYPPLLDLYRASQHRVVRLGRNAGHLAPWTEGIVGSLAWGERYIVTDPDILPADDCPLDAIARFHALLDAHPGTDKVGFGLRIDDLPERYAHRERVVRWERRFWKDEVAPGAFRAEIDTTFALYREGAGHALERALRTGPPCVARHATWYVDSAAPSEEERYYAAHADPDISSWTSMPGWLADASAPAEDRLDPDRALAEIRERARTPTDISDHLETLFLETVAARPRLVVELGVRGGESTFALERAARCAGACVVGVDIDDCSGACAWPSWSFVQADDVAFAARFPAWCTERGIEPAIDVLFIDTSHELEHTRRELSAWVPHLAARAKVLFHDTHLRALAWRRDGTPAEGYDERGVTAALEELLGAPIDETRDFAAVLGGWRVRHFAYCHGLTILERGPGA